MGEGLGYEERPSLWEAEGWAPRVWNEGSEAGWTGACGGERVVAVVRGEGGPGLCPTSDCIADGAEAAGQGEAEPCQGGLLILPRGQPCLCLVRGVLGPSRPGGG